MKRGFKLLGILSLLSGSYLVLISAFLPYRATNDEATPALDIKFLLEHGQRTSSFAYSNGNSYQTGTTLLLKLLGLEYPATELISPIIGAVVISLFLFVAFKIYNDSNPEHWWSFILISSATLVFPGFLFRLRQTSHKSYTFSLIFVLILLVYGIMKSNSPNHRRKFLLLLSILSLSFSNFFWAGIYGTVLLLPLLAVKRVRNSAIYIIPLPGVASYITAHFLPTTLYHKQWIITTLLSGRITRRIQETDAFSKQEGILGAAGTSTNLINQWPSVEILNISFSAWFIYVTGIIIVGLITIVAMGMAALLWIKRNLSVFGKQMLVMNAVIGILLFLLLALKDLSTFKRLIVLPGLLGALYWTIMLDSQQFKIHLPDKLEKKSTYIMAFVILLLIISIGLAFPRVAVDGHESPIDKYGTRAEITKLNWMSTYESHCLRTHQKTDLQLARRFVADQVSMEKYETNNQKIFSHKIYISSNKSVISCNSGGGALYSSASLRSKQVVARSAYATRRPAQGNVRHGL